MSTLPVVERLILPKLAYAVVYHGVADRHHPEHSVVLRQLEAAIDDELDGLSTAKRDSARRHADRAAAALLQPFIDANEKAAKFGLAVFYATQALIEDGLYELRDGAFSDAMDAILHPEGTVTEIANVDRLDASAAKQGRRLITALHSLGYFNEQGRA